MSDISQHNRIFTHGFVHGHVHQHNDHVHIHGHIHNHDHLGYPGGDYNSSSGGNDEGNGTNQGWLVDCKELENGYNMCNDIFCDELDDCYFDDCDDPTPRASGSSSLDKRYTEDSLEKCAEKGTLGSGPEECFSESGIVDHSQHDNSLCDYQKPKVTIFENLIQNVHKNVEQYFAPQPDGKIPQMLDGDHSHPQFQVHFPHHCHQDDVVPADNKNVSVMTGNEQWKQSDHTMHKSCFHAKIPASYHTHKPVNEDAKTESQYENFSLGSELSQVNGSQTQQKNDYDFFVQFNNFKQLFEDQLTTPADVREQENYSNPEDSTYACQWDSCSELVKNDSLVDHLVTVHLKDLHQTGSSSDMAKVECDWNDCHFSNDDWSSFLSHLNTHKVSTSDKLPAVDTQLPDGEDAQSRLDASLPTPESIEATSLSPILSNARKSVPGDKGKDFLDISQVKISPKTANVGDPLDSNFTCKWQIGTDDKGEAILCDKPHSNTGDLQEHLQEEHIGRGKSIYHCCWHGCERNQGKPFTQRQKLFRHIHVHTGHKPCTCNICGASFAVPAMLNQHHRIHSGERPYVCKVCGKSFTTTSSLVIHNRVHTNEKPLQCTWPGCGKRFRENSNLTKHMKIHTRKFTCDSCGKTFNCRRLFSKHVKSHKT